jgi:hypothetical protein
MAHRDCGDKFLVAQKLAFHRRVIERNTTKTHVDTTLLQSSNLLEAGQLYQSNLHVGTGRAVTSDHLRQFAIERRSNEANTESITIGLVKASYEGPHLVDTLEHLDGLLVEQPPGLAKP